MGATVVNVGAPRLGLRTPYTRSLYDLRMTCALLAYAKKLTRESAMSEGDDPPVILGHFSRPKRDIAS